MLHIICGPPCSGKSTYVDEHAEAGDVRIDFDVLAQALGSTTPHASEGSVRDVTFEARRAAIRWCVRHADECDAWIIHSSPADWQMDAYRKAGAEIVELDEDMETCLERAEQDGRPPDEADKIREWFASHQAPKGAFFMPIGGTEMTRKTKDATEQLEVAEGGSFVGYAATFDREPDAYGDVIAKGAFADTIKAWEGRAEQGVYIPLLWGHNTDDPKYNIGRITKATEDERGLLVEGEFDASSAKAQYVRKLLKEGRVFQMSFAYDVLDEGDVELEGGASANELRKLDLFECSIVQIPANQHAEVIEVKSTDAAAKSGRRNSKADEGRLRELREHAAAIQTILNDLLGEGGDEPQPEAPQAEEIDEQGEQAKAADKPDANAEDPDEGNAEEPTEEPDAEEVEREQRKQARIAELVKQAEQILNHRK